MTGEPVRPLRVGAALLLAALVPLLGARLFVEGAAAACSAAAAHACCCAPVERSCPPRGGCCEVRPGQPLPVALAADAVAPAAPVGEAPLASVPAPGPLGFSPELRAVPHRARSAPLFVLHAALLI